jgi:hypothetical protein
MLYATVWGTVMSGLVEYELTRDFWSRLMFPRLVEQGELDHDKALYARGDHPQAA